MRDLRVIVAGTLSAMLLAACGGPAEEASADPSAPAGAGDATTEASEGSSGAATASEEATAGATEGQGADYEDFDANAFDASSIEVDNRWFPLQPGTRLTYEGVTVEDGEEIPHEVIFTVTDLTKEIAGVQTVAIWDQDISDGELEESEIAFFAQATDGTVWHFGQYPEEYDGEEIVDTPAWIAGVGDGRPGIAMKADPDVGGDSYSQGWAPSVDWYDRGQAVEEGLERCVPADCFTDVLLIEESSRDEPGAFQLKYYAPDVGNIEVGFRGDDPSQETLALVEATQLDADGLAEANSEALALEERAYELTSDVFGPTPPMQPRGSASG